MFLSEREKTLALKVTGTDNKLFTIALAVQSEESSSGTTRSTSMFFMLIWARAK